MSEIRGERVLVWRRARRLTQAECARAAGVSAKTISRIEQGQCRVLAGTVARLALAPETSADYLLGLTDDLAPTYSSQGGDNSCS